MKSPVNSFTSADAFPVKLIKDTQLVRHIMTHKIIPPVHAQIIPTNACNLACAFCSCANEDRSLSMTPQQLVEVMATLSSFGTRSITITGGGEPLLHPNFDIITRMLSISQIKAGLVTNGLLLNPKIACVLRDLTWCRISFGDEREPFDDNFKFPVQATVLECPGVDWAFSYVVSESPNIERIKDLILFADRMHFTHVRLVADLLDPDKVPMDKVKKELNDLLSHMTVPVIFQGRQHPEKGLDCYIGYLKPVIAPDLRVYACCGVQYALAEPSKRLPDELCMGHFRDWLEIVKQSGSPFKGGHKCVKCYYGGYNRVLKSLLEDTEHGEFV